MKRREIVAERKIYLIKYINESSRWIDKAWNIVIRNTICNIFNTTGFFSPR